MTTKIVNGKTIELLEEDEDDYHECEYDSSNEEKTPYQEPEKKSMQEPFLNINTEQSDYIFITKGDHVLAYKLRDDFNAEEIIKWCEDYCMKKHPNGIPVIEEVEEKKILEWCTQYLIKKFEEGTP